MYQVGTQDFRTKADVSNYIRDMVDRYGEREPLDAGDFAFMLALLHSHPNDKIKGGIDSMWVQHNHEYGNNRCFYLQYPDGSVDDASWHQCVKGLKKVELQSA